MEIKSYLKCELKIRPSDIEKFDIIKIFHPAKEDWNVLYVEFGSEYQVDQLFSYTKGMKKDHRIVRWYPKQMYDRYRAVETIAYHLRKSMQHKTRVRIGLDDIELSSRESGSTFWRKQSLPNNLPNFDLDYTTRPAPASSPPPGRPSRTELIMNKYNMGMIEQAATMGSNQPASTTGHLEPVHITIASSPSKIIPDLSVSLSSTGQSTK